MFPISGAANFPAGHFTHVFIDEVGAPKCRTLAGVSTPTLTEPFEVESKTSLSFGGQLIG